MASMTHRIKRWLLAFAKIGLGFAVLWWLAHSDLLELSQITALFASPWLIALGAPLILLTITLGNWKWCLLLRAQGMTVPFWRAWRMYYISVACNHILPGSVSGDLVRMLFIAHHVPDRRMAAVFSILADRMLGLLVVLVLSTLLTWLWWDKLALSILSLLPSLPGDDIIYPGIALVAIALGGWMLTRRGISRLSNSQRLRSLLDAISSYRRHKMLVMANCLISFASQIIFGFTLTMIGWEMGAAHLGLLENLLGSSLAQLLSILPVSPGGLGIGEAAFANLLLLLTSTAFSYASIYLAYRILYAFTVLPALAWYLARRNKPGAEALTQ